MAEAKDDVKPEGEVETPVESSTTEQTPEETSEITESLPTAETEEATETTDDVVEASAEEARAKKYVPYDRFQREVEKRRQAEANQSQEAPTPTDGPDPTALDSDQEAALDKWMTDKGYVKKEAVESLEDRRIIDSTHNSLETKYAGQDGRPKYDRAKVEGFMASNGVYDPEVAYKALNEPELTDYAIKQALKNPSAYSAKPSRPAAPNVGPTEQELIAEAERTKDWTTIIKRRFGLGKQEGSYSDQPE